MRDGEIPEATMLWRNQIIVITNFGRMLRYYRDGMRGYVWQEVCSRFES